VIEETYLTAYIPLGKNTSLNNFDKKICTLTKGQFLRPFFDRVICRVPLCAQLNVGRALVFAHYPNVPVSFLMQRYSVVVYIYYDLIHGTRL